MVKEALVLARLARYVLRRISEAKREGWDATAYYGVFHKIVQLLPRVLTGKISPEDMKPLLDFLDKSGMSAKMEGRADAKGKSNKGGGSGKGNWVTIHGTHIQIGKSGQVTKGPANLQGKTIPKVKPQGGQPKSGGSSGGSGTSNSSGNTGNHGNTAKAKPQAKQAPQTTQQSQPSSNTGNSGNTSQATSKSSSVAKGVTNFHRKNGKMRITSDVKVQTNQTPVTLKSGTEVSKIVDFAGPNKKRPVAVESHLIKKYGGQQGSWTHTRGEADVVLQDGSVKKAELHWFESKGIGQVSIKVKRYIK